MPTWSPGSIPCAWRWCASRLARASISAYVHRLPSATMYSRSPKLSTACSKRSARLYCTAGRLEHVLASHPAASLQRVPELGGAVHGVGIDLGDHVLTHEANRLEVLLAGRHADAEHELVGTG